MNTYSSDKIYESYSNEVERMQKYIDELLQENKRLKMIIKEYERLNKVNGRGFKITNVKEYNIDELLSYKEYKDNWNKLKKHLKEKIAEGRSTEHLWLMGCYDEDKLILDKMQEIEKESDE